MKNLDERGSFEEQIQGFFEEAEVSPSIDLWTKIDADLANDKADQYRRRAFIYQWVAAASLILAVSFAAISYLFQQEQPSGKIADGMKVNTENTVNNDNLSENIDNNSKIKSDGNDGGSSGSFTEENTADSKLAKTEDEKEQPEQMLPEYTNNKRPKNSQPALLQPQKENMIALNESLRLRDKRPIAQLDGVNRPMYKHIDKRPTLEDIGLIPKEEKMPENFWAGVNFSSGLFDPGVSESSSFSTAALTSDSYSRDASNVIPAGASYRMISAENSFTAHNTESESVTPGISYTAGFNTGFRLGKKWTIETGIAYVNNTNQSETYTIIETRENNVIPLTMANYQDQNQNLGRLKYSYEDIQLNNSYEFVSVPLKAAYWLLQSNLSLAITAGVSTNIFIQNHVANQSSNIEDITVNPGEQSPYRNMYFNGILGTQITYQFPGAPYSLMLEPNYSLALNHMTKDDYYFDSRPRSFMIGVGLRYHFN